MTRRQRLGLWMALVLGAACRPAPQHATVHSPALHLTTDRTRYRAGDTVQVVLRNDDTRTWMYNLCPYYTQRREGGSWVYIDSAAIASRICDRVGHGIEPGRTAGPRFVELPGTLAAGTYRFVFAGLPAGSQRATPAFAVEPRG